jgi:protein subunit release factor A
MALNMTGTRPVALVRQNVFVFKEKSMKRVIEIRAAEGGEDSKLFVANMAQAYRKFAERRG